jgi:hypothetical protein
MLGNMIKMLAIVACLILQGCAYYGVRYGIDEPTTEINTLNQLSYKYEISKEPSISITSYCTSEGYNFLVGPVIGIPWLIIPSVFGIVEHYSAKKEYSYIEVSLRAPPTEIQVTDSSLSLLVDNEEVPVTSMVLINDYWKIGKTFKYKVGLSCSELSNKELAVHYKSATENIISPIFKVRKEWGVRYDLM